MFISYFKFIFCKQFLIKQLIPFQKLYYYNSTIIAQKTKIMFKQVFPQQRPIRPQYQLAKSQSVSSVLYGNNQQPNSHFIDFLQRFKKDFATADKEERQKQRQKKLQVLQEKKNFQQKYQSRIKNHQYELDQKQMIKYNQSRYLYQTGQKKTAHSLGIPVNPITLKYHQNQNGNIQKFLDQQQKLRRIVRAHHLQTSSTCGYNPVNGSGIPNFQPLLPKNTQGRFQAKLTSFYDQYKMNPNVDLKLNPKHILPKHVGQLDRQNCSPIKRQVWQQEDQKQYETSYKTHFNDKLQASRGINYGNNATYFNMPATQNTSAYMQDSAYRSQTSLQKK